MLEFLEFLEKQGLESRFWRDMRGMSPDFCSGSMRKQYLFSDFQKYIIPQGHNPFAYFTLGGF